MYAFDFALETLVYGLVLFIEYDAAFLKDFNALKFVTCRFDHHERKAQFRIALLKPMFYLTGLGQRQGAGARAYSNDGIHVKKRALLPAQTLLKASP